MCIERVTHFVKKSFEPETKVKTCFQTKRKEGIRTRGTSHWWWRPKKTPNNLAGSSSTNDAGQSDLSLDENSQTGSGAPYALLWGHKRGLGSSLPWDRPWRSWKPIYPLTTILGAVYPINFWRTWMAHPLLRKTLLNYLYTLALILFFFQISER